MDSRVLLCVGSWTVAALVAAVGLSPIGSAAAGQAGGQAPVFRSGVDLVAVDVQVVDGTGTPIESLGPDDFEVSIDGRRRRVVSADFVRSTQLDGSPLPDAAPVAAAAGGNGGSSERTRDTTGRIYVLAFDTAGMTVGDSRAMVRSATAFIDRLLPTDRVGVAVFPVGNQLAPSTDHFTARQRVSEVVGARANSDGFDSRFNLSSSEVIDINAESVRAMPSPFINQGRGGGGTTGLEDLTLLGDDNDTIRTVQMRECRATDVRCGDEIRAEALAAAFVMEARAVESMRGIQRLIDLLSGYEGRKTVVMFSAGMPTSDRPGGRPHLGSLPAAVGKAAAASNTTIYTLHVDSAQVRAMGAGTGRAMGSAGTRSRDFAVEGQVLEDFSAASGGALLRVPTGWGETALARVLRETSSRYLLGVEPQSSDRDGRVRELRVRVRQRGVTVRGRTWVVMR
ncbi:MAG: VWA domain-containing protein [Acidobacteria bacterium]|nr:VWA domain-containing protein [Acidobacteriota bacterium]